MTRYARHSRVVT